MEAVLEGGDPLVSVIPVVEQHVTHSTAQPPAQPYEVQRREQTLVRTYATYLRNRGSSVGLLRVVPTGEANALRNDVYDETRENIVEAKGTGTRAAVRMALAQVLDYGRFAPEARRAVLLPERARPYLEELLHTYDIHVVWPTSSGFADNADRVFT